MQEQLTPKPAQRPSIAVDAMGGDKAPQEIVAGAVAAARVLPAYDIVLVGDEAAVRACLPAGGVPDNLIIHHASQVVSMTDAPGAAVRQKRDSSIGVGMRLVRDGAAQVFISAGNSGAMMAAATLILKPQPGVDRPAIATLMPTLTGSVVLLDAGANSDCKPAHLEQFARLGSIYASSIYDCPNPRVGLLSIGEEPSKGNELTKETHQLLLTAKVNFVGNVEPKEVVRGDVEVAVADGFVGNLMLKSGEGFGEMIMTLIGTEIRKNWLTSLCGLLMKPAFRRVRARFDYAEYGGALLLGVNGVVIIGHGRSNALAIENAIRRLGVRMVERHLAERMRSSSEDALADSVTP